MNQIAAIATPCIPVFKTSRTKNVIAVAVIFGYPVTAIHTLISVPFGTTPTPPFIRIFKVDEVFRTTVLFAMFAERKFIPAGFAIDILLSVNDVVIFIVDEVFPAVGTLSQMFVPAIRAKVKLPVDFEFFRRSADVTIQYVLGIHSDLHWLVVTTTRRRFAGNRGAF
jgi:hypothetical protein